MKYIIQLFTIALFLVTVPALCAEKTAGTYVDDGVLHSKVKTKLIGDEFFQGMGVNIEVSKGVVQLAGFVDTQEQRDRGGKSAESVPGVVRVSNQLHLKSGSRSAGQVVDDTLIASQVRTGLGGDLSVNVDVYNGVVLLSGFVDSLDEKETAIEVARNVNHVTKILSGIEINE